MARPFAPALVLGLVVFLMTSSVVLAAPPGPQGPQGQAAPLVSQPAAPSGGGNCGVTYFKTFSGWEFRTLAPDTMLGYVPATGSLYRTGGSDFIDLPLDLPQGARIIQVNFYHRDNLATDMTFYLSRYTPWTGGYGYIVSASSSGQSEAVQTRVLTAATACEPLATVDNAEYRYALETVFHATGDQARLYGAAVIYQMPTAYLPFSAR